MDTASPGTALRAARTERGWSQAEAARELASLGRARGAPTASPASLKTQLSRWENDHVVPEPIYRELLAELFGRPDLLGGPPRPEPAADAAGRLRDAVAEADAVDDGALRLLRAHLESGHRLDRRLGAAGAGATVEALVEHLTRALSHTTDRSRRMPLAGLLAEAALLAGWQALDQDRPDAAFAGHDHAHAAAREAQTPELCGAALAGQSAALLAVGLPGPAAAVLDAAPTDGPGAAWAAAARGAVLAAGGDTTASRDAFDRAADALSYHPDVVRPGIAIDLGLLHRFRSSALAPHGDDTALAGLRTAVTDAAVPVREHAGLQADLALALLARGGPERSAEAAEHARDARALATRIGSHRVRRRLDTATAGPG